MTKTFQMEDLDCANCAAKMEAAISKIKMVQAARVNFITQQITIEAEDTHFATVMQQVVKVCHKIEPDCKIVLA